MSPNPWKKNNSIRTYQVWYRVHVWNPLFICIFRAAGYSFYTRLSPIMVIQLLLWLFRTYMERGNVATHRKKKQKTQSRKTRYFQQQYNEAFPQKRGRLLRAPVSWLTRPSVKGQGVASLINMNSPPGRPYTNIKHIIWIYIYYRNTTKQVTIR